MLIVLILVTAVFCYWVGRMDVPSSRQKTRYKGLVAIAEEKDMSVKMWKVRWAKCNVRKRVIKSLREGFSITELDSKNTLTFACLTVGETQELAQMMNLEEPGLKFTPTERFRAPALLVERRP